MRFPLHKFFFYCLISLSYGSKAQSADINENTAELCPIPFYPNIAQATDKINDDSFTILSSTSSI